MINIDKRILNFLVILVFTFITFWWTFFIFHQPFEMYIVLSVLAIRMVASRFIFDDYSLSWSKASQKSFIIKSIVYVAAFFVYLPIFYGEVRFAFLASELFLYLFLINFTMYFYYYLINKSRIEKTKSVVIYGAGRAGIKLESEFSNTEYKVKYFVDDDKAIEAIMKDLNDQFIAIDTTDLKGNTVKEKESLEVLQRKYDSILKKREADDIAKLKRKIDSLQNK